MDQSLDEPDEPISRVRLLVLLRTHSQGRLQDAPAPVSVAAQTENAPGRPALHDCAATLRMDTQEPPAIQA